MLSSNKRNQIINASTIILSRTGNIKEAKLAEALDLIKALNPNVQVITTPWEQLSGKAILEAIENPVHASDMANDLLKEINEEHEHECGCHHHHHDDDEDEHECHCHDHEHEHHHEHDEECTCGCHDHEHEHHHEHGEECT